MPLIHVDQFLELAPTDFLRSCLAGDRNCHIPYLQKYPSTSTVTHLAKILSCLPFFCLHTLLRIGSKIFTVNNPEVSRYPGCLGTHIHESAGTNKNRWSQNGTKILLDPGVIMTWLSRGALWDPIRGIDPTS